MPRSDVRSAFQYGLVVFTLTALLGLANATQLLGTLDRNTLLTHLHSGTLGWITMGVIGVALWMFGGRDRNMPVRVSALATAAYVLAFWSGNFLARATFGSIELLVVFYWWWFVLSSARTEGIGGLPVAKLSVVLGLTTLVIGSSIGVFVQILYATNNMTPDGANLIGAHAAAQVGGYLILVGAGAIEWQIGRGGKRTIFGTAQVALLFVAGLLLAIADFVGGNATRQFASLLQIVATVVIVARIGRQAAGVPWMQATGARHLAIAIAYLIVSLGLIVKLVATLGEVGGDFTKIPPGLIHALDHATFVGLMTNVLFGAILVATTDRPRVWPWADHVIFWGLNIGAAGFIAVLVLVGSGEGAKPFTHPVSFVAPIMGLSALLGVATFLMRLQDAAAAPAATPAR